MTFVNSLLTMISKGFGFIADMIFKVIQFLAKPLTYVYYFFEGIFYFLMQLFNVAVKVIMIFVALVQFFVAIVTGFLRTVFKMLTIDFSAAPNYSADSLTGIKLVTDLLQPMGLLTVVPMICLALIWLLFAKRIIGLLGSSGGAAD